MESKENYFERCKKRIENAEDITLNWDVDGFLKEFAVDNDLKLRKGMYAYGVKFKLTNVPVSDKEKAELYNMAESRKIELDKPKKELMEKLENERIAAELAEL